MKSTLRNVLDIGADAFWRDIFFNHEFLERMYKEALGCEAVAFLEDSGDLTSGRSRRLTFTQKLEPAFSSISASIPRVVASSAPDSWTAWIRRPTRA